MQMQSFRQRMYWWLTVLLLAAIPMQATVARAQHPLSDVSTLSPDPIVAQSSAPAELDQVSYTLGRASKVVANQTIAVGFIAGGLVLFDIRQPAQPRMISQLVLQTIYPEIDFNGADIAMVGDYVFVTCSRCHNAGSNIGLVVVNIAVPTRPVVVGSMKTTGSVTVIKADGDLLYMGMMSGHAGDYLAVVDIRNPATPQLLGKQQISDRFAFIIDIEIVATAAARYALVTSQMGTLLIMDVTVPTNPFKVATYAPEQACMLNAAVVYHAEQPRFYVTDCSVGLRVLDVTFPPQPREIQTYRFDPARKPYAVTAVGHHVFVATNVDSNGGWDSTLHVIDASGTLLESSRFTDLTYVHDLKILDQILMVVDEKYGLQLLDFANPAALQVIGRTTKVDAFSDLDSDGRYLYLADGNGFKVLDLINPIAPRYAAEVAIPHAANVEVDAGFALITDWHAGLQIFDVHDPTQPTLISHTPVSITLTTDIVISGTLGTQATAFISASGCNGFDVNQVCENLPTLIAVDVTNLQQPITSIVLAQGEGVADMVQLGDFLYLITGNPLMDNIASLLVLDIANPALPITVDRMTLPAMAASIARADQTLYIAFADSLQTYDIANPAKPLLKHTLALPRYQASIAIHDGFLYASATTSLSVISLAEPFQPVLIERHALLEGAGIVAANGILATNEFVYVLGGGLSIWQHQADVLGRVLDGWGEPQAGVRINAVPETTTVVSATTSSIHSGLTGSYALTNNMTDTYTLQPVVDDYAVWPPTRTGVSQATTATQDFYLLAQPVSVTVDAGAAATLSYQDGRGLSTTVAIGAGAVTEASVVRLTPIMAFDQGDDRFTGNAFALEMEAVNPQAQKPTLAQPVTITIHYSDQGANGLLAEDSYRLLTEVDGSWQALPAAAQANRVARHRAENSFSVAVNAPGRYALFGKAHAAYLPWIAQ